MADYHAEVPLEPGKVKHVFYYLSEDEQTLVTLSWMEGDHHFSVVVGGEPPEFVELPTDDNPYVVDAAINDWLDHWTDDHESEIYMGAV